MFRRDFDMSNGDYVVKNKDGALNSKAKKYSDSSSDEDVKLPGKCSGFSINGVYIFCNTSLFYNIFDSFSKNIRI